MDIKAWEKPASIHFCSTSLQRHSSTPCVYKTPPACVKAFPLRNFREQVQNQEDFIHHRKHRGKLTLEESTAQV